jgi:aspartyl-tRNA(Asn)/glutamyl-tRNA(Gln) amidotransferase subunit A
MTNEEITKLGVVEAKNALEEKKFSAVENVNAFQEKIEKSKLNSYITTTFDYALERAKKVDSGEIKGRLAGVVFGVKDVFCTKGIRTTCGSKMLENFVPEYNATVWERLENEGAIIIGKNNMDEFSMGSSNLTSYFGGVENPYHDKRYPDKKLIPGGSSGGGAAAVADNLCNVAIGGDTGGSLRQPASLCNIVGVRPTYGRCSRHGLIAYSSSLDQAGVLSKNVDDSALILDIMSGDDQNDSIMFREKPMNNYEKIKKLDVDKDDLSGYTIGIPVECKSDNILPSINELWKKTADFLVKKGAKVKEISIENLDKAIEVYYTISTAEAYSNLARFDGVRYGYRSNKSDNILELYSNTKIEGFGDEVKRRILTGAYVLSSDHYKDTFIRGTKARRIISRNFAKAFEEVDVILMPVSPCVAFGWDEKLDPISMYMCDIFTIPSAIAGLAGISVPVGFDSDSGLPIGMQIVPKLKDEETMFKIAKYLEQGHVRDEI